MTISKQEKPYEIILAGVGGQGVLTMTDILCDSALGNGYDVRGSETHGMAQRGGSIVTTVRIATGSSQAFAPLVREQSGDVLIATEPAEALRHARYISHNGVILTNIKGVPPPSMTHKREKYPDINEIVQALQKFCSNVITIDGTGIAEFAGSPASLNVVMLGALTQVNGFPLSAEIVEDNIHSRFRERFKEVNKRAFEGGKEAFLKLPK